MVAPRVEGERKKMLSQIISLNTSVIQQWHSKRASEWTKVHFGFDEKAAVRLQLQWCN